MRREALTMFGREILMKLSFAAARRKCGSRFTGAVYERCVLCGRETDVPLDLPIARRDCCIEGGGQLCRDCLQKLYGR